MRTFSTQYGNNPSMFGHKDYYEARNQGGTDLQILSFLEKNPNLLYSGNKKGVSTGLFEQLMGQARNQLGRINPLAGNSVDRYGHADYQDSIGRGATNQQILDYLDQRPDLLFERNRKGVQGGLYEHILGRIPKSEQKIDPQIADLQNQLTASKTELQGFKDRFDDNQRNYTNQIASLRSNLGNYTSQISNYQDQISRLDQRLLEQTRKANQFKNMDTQYLTGNKAAGIRLRKSRKRRLGISSLGTASLNRKNRPQLQIGNVNV